MTQAAAQPESRPGVRGRPLGPEGLLGLQQVAGNAAVSNLLSVSRQQAPGPQPASGPQPAEPTLGPDDFEVRGWDITPGPVSAAPQSGGRLEITSPDIHIRGTVGLKLGRTLGPGVIVDAGPIQSVISDNMLVKFTEDGAPGGKPVGEVHRVVPTAYDAASTPNPPWYTQDTSQPRLSDHSGEVNIHLYDRPHVSLLPTMGSKGRVSQFEGLARFHTAIGIRSITAPDRLIAVKPIVWEVPWTLTIAWDPATSQPLPATGQTVKSGPGVGAPPKLDGPPANTLQMFWMTTSDPEADQQDRANPMNWPSGTLWTVPTPLLLQYFIPARRNDPAAYANLKGELERRHFYATVTCKKRAGHVGNDWVEVGLTGQRPGGTTEFTFDDNETKQVSAPMRALWPDLDGIEQASTLTMTLHEHGPLRGSNDATASVPYSFDEGRSVTLGNGRYTVYFGGD